MKIQKIKIPPEKLDVNYKFYYFIKVLNSTGGLNENDVKKFIEIIFTYGDIGYEKSVQQLDNLADSIQNEDRKITVKELLYLIKNDFELTLFTFSLKLLQIKPLLLAEAKLVEIAEISNLSEIHSLSLKYDTISKSKPYFTRVNGALLSLLLFSKIEEKDSNFLSDAAENYVKTLFAEYEILKKHGVEANQIFMLMFSESINQSIISDAGTSYEDRIFNILIALGINKDEIHKIHDETDSSTEFDFFFKLEGKTFGIGAKRTLRERYKQFIKTAYMAKLDVMIEFTLGIDLTPVKAKSIRDHSVYLFVANEIYESKPFLKQIEGIYPATAFTLSLLKELSNKVKA